LDKTVIGNSEVSGATFNHVAPFFCSQIRISSGLYLAGHFKEAGLTQIQMLRKDRVGQKWGLLTVKEFHGRNSARCALWLCVCTCGNTTIVEGSTLQAGRVKSCGCLRREMCRVMGTNNITHGGRRHGKRTPENCSFTMMLSRCYNPKATGYKRYGGRGIRVCRQWRHSFKNFLADMGTRPVGTTLDRVNPNGNYTRRNCRWRTPAQQQQNTRRTKLSALKVRTIRQAAPYFSFKELATEYGVSANWIGRVVAGKAWAHV
jgi:hypothetical protein